MIKNVIVIFLLIISIRVYGQTNNVYPCKTDSIIYHKTLQLVNNGIQNIMTFYYYYDNGHVSGEYYYLLWQDSLEGHFMKIGCCDQPCLSDTLSATIKDIFKYYEQNRIDTITNEIESQISMSHDWGYFIKVYYPNKTRSFNIRNYQRGVGIQIDGKRIDGKETFKLQDPRIVWLNKVETFAKQIN